MQKTKLSTRTLSLLIAVLTVLGILPSSIMMASAGDPIPPPSESQLATIKLESANDDGTLKNPPSMPAEIRLDKYYQVSGESGSYGKYHISTLNRNVSHFTCDFDLGSNNIVKGFCTQYGLHIGTDLENAMWKNPEKVTTANYSEDVIRFLDYYAYLQTLHKEVHNHYFPELGECTPDVDNQIANGEVDSPYKDKFTVFKGWTQGNIDEIANQAQAFIWAAQEIGPAYKPFSDSYYRTLACKDRVSLVASFNGGTITEAKANEWFEQIYSAIMASTDIPHFDHYIYHYGSGVQNMLVSLIPTPRKTKEGFFVKVQKMMEGRPLQGAKFKVYKDSACNVPFADGEMVSDANGIAISNELDFGVLSDGSTTFTVYVKETEAPSGSDGATIGISDEVVAITVGPTVNNTRDNPATNPEAIFEDFTQPDKVFLRKVDAITNEPVGPGEYQFENENGAQKFWTNDEGVLELQWWKPGDENYIAPGHYSVTETTPPEGYLGTDEVIAVDLWIEDGKPYSSGPIIFKNYKKFRIELLKVDENNQPLAGAEFKIWKDGEEFATKTSGPDGMVVLEDLQPGEYLLSEIKTPSGKVIPINHVFKFSLREDSEIRVYQAVCVNHDLPELVIKKLEKGTNKLLPGAEFKVTIDGNEIPTEATGENGTIIITPENYGRYMDETKETHTVVVKEIKAPAGYDIDQPDTQTLTLKKGQTKAYFTFTDTKHGEIIIRKFKEGTAEKLSGAEFKVVIDGNELGSYTTGPEGEIHITSDEYSAIWDGNAETHSVTVTETKAPAGYLKADPDTQELKMNKGQKLLEFSFYDKPYSDILIVKRDKETQEPLPGATFDISIDGKKIPGCPYTTDDNGEIKISYEICKDYLNEENTGGWAVTVTELTAPDGYNLDNQPESGSRSVTQILKPGQSLIPFEFEDTSYRKIRVIKKDAETNWPLEGAEFLLHSVDGHFPDRTGETEKDGSLTFDKLPNGTYELQETRPPKGYSEKGTWADGGGDVKTIVLTSDCEPILTYERRNTAKTGILIRKIDAVTKLPLAGVTFRITPRSPLTGDPFDRTTEEDGIFNRDRA